MRDSLTHRKEKEKEKLKNDRRTHTHRNTKWKRHSRRLKYHVADNFPGDSQIPRGDKSLWRRCSAAAVAAERRGRSIGCVLRFARGGENSFFALPAAEPSPDGQPLCMYVSRHALVHTDTRQPETEIPFFFHLPFTVIEREREKFASLPTPDDALYEAGCRRGFCFFARLVAISALLVMYNMHMRFWY